MLATFRTGPAASGVNCTTSIEYYSVLLNHLSKNLDVSHDEKIPIIMKIGKPKLSVYFLRAGTLSIHYKPFLKAAIRGEQFLASGIVGSPLNSINFCKTSK